ncbi:hypothetical protein AMATHDRAFT_61080 [Amanita thiersii Skay4041]|uniref:Uncharacterized protein n=1 Tax=Amanita thiersii Skay4041 TaxID=703135 RepID=A0A2A9NHL3_9AGAR|nr:hypothetical protein AMATHDRAFT_61080 [Amanita thiersii Skay4041]
MNIRIRPAADIINLSATNCTKTTSYPPSDLRDISHPRRGAVQICHKRQKKSDPSTINPDESNIRCSNDQLPAEILHIIFKLCAARVTFPLRMRTPSTAVVLSQVCVIWRRVALTTTELWADVEIVGSARQDVIDNIVDQWLSRAGKLLMSVRWKYFKPGFNTPIHDLFFADRLKEITLIQRHLEVPQLLSMLSNAPLSQLKRLELTCYAEGRDTADIPLLCNHCPFPNLEFLMIYSWYDFFTAEHLSLPWGCLRHLEINIPMPFSEVMNGFREGSSLEKCTLYIYADDSDLMPQSDIHLPCLELLRVTVVDLDLGLLMRPLVLPNLRCLMIEGDDVIWNATAYSFMSQRSKFNRLQKVCIGDLGRALVDVDQLLEASPTLSDLQVRTSHIRLTPEALTLLSTGVLGPSLKRLDTTCFVSPGLVLTMLEARLKHVEAGHSEQGQAITLLDDVSFKVTEDLDPYLRRIVALIVEGIEIKLHRVYPAGIIH